MPADKLQTQDLQAEPEAPGVVALCLPESATDKSDTTFEKSPFGQIRPVKVFGPPIPKTQKVSRKGTSFTESDQLFFDKLRLLRKGVEDLQALYVMDICHDTGLEPEQVFENIRARIQETRSETSELEDTTGTVRVVPVFAT